MKDETFLRTIRERFDDAHTGDIYNREMAFDDLKHITGEQWPDDVKQSRIADKRPCLTINRLPQFLRQVTGDIRRTNPAINIIPGDAEASADTAEIVEGLVRSIEYSSNATRVYEATGEGSAAAGISNMRVLTEYEGPNTFDQCIKVEQIPNPFAVYWDPLAKEPTRADARYCFVVEEMDRKDFEAQYPDKAIADFESVDDADFMQHWSSADSVRVAEYFWKKPVRSMIYLMPDGSVSTQELPGYVDKREVVRDEIWWAKVNGVEFLTEPRRIAGKFLPVVAVCGEEIHLGERTVRSSVVRYAKDPQRLYNYWRSAQTELIALQPKAPYLVTPRQIQGLENYWETANVSNKPFLPYNPDEDAPGRPQRETPPVPSSGMMQEVALAADDLKSTTGIYDAALGNQGNETSGVAIKQRQIEGDISTSIYVDNLAEAIGQVGRIIVDLIPSVYDTTRAIRIIGKEGAEKIVDINRPVMTEEGPAVENDLKIGKYDVRVATGPSYTTRRQEAAEGMIAFVQAFPQAAAVIGDLVAKSQEWPGADEIAERLKKTIPPEILEDPEEEMTPEQMMAKQQAMQAQQAAQAMQQAMAEAEVRKAMAEANESEADAGKARIEAATEALQLSLTDGTMKAQIEAMVAQAAAEMFTQ